MTLTDFQFSSVPVKIFNTFLALCCVFLSVHVFSLECYTYLFYVKIETWALIRPRSTKTWQSSYQRPNWIIQPRWRTPWTNPFKPCRFFLTKRIPRIVSTGILHFCSPLLYRKPLFLFLYCFFFLSAFLLWIFSAPYNGIILPSNLLALEIYSGHLRSNLHVILGLLIPTLVWPSSAKLPLLPHLWTRPTWRKHASKLWSCLAISKDYNVSSWPYDAYTLRFFTLYSFLLYILFCLPLFLVLLLTTFYLLPDLRLIWDL